MDISIYKKLIDTELKKLLDRKILHIEKYNLNKRLLSIHNYAYDFLLNAGKRIRPYLVYLSYKSFGGQNDDDIIKFSLAFELFHNFALIHDDIIDEGTIRHGVPTYHEFIKNLIKNNKNYHFAISQAILVGDLFFNWSYELINADYNFDKEKLQLARNLYNEMINETILGEMIDVELMTDGKKADEKIVLEKNFLKTANYTFIKPIKIGAKLCGINSNQETKLYELGECLGQAYQIVDDLNDIMLEKSDKTLFSDIQEGQQTIFTNFIFKNGKLGNQKILKDCLGKRLNNNQILRLKQIFQDSGAIDYGKKLIEDYLYNSKKILDNIEFVDNKYKSNFEDIVEYLKN